MCQLIFAKFERSRNALQARKSHSYHYLTAKGIINYISQLFSSKRTTGCHPNCQKYLKKMPGKTENLARCKYLNSSIYKKRRFENKTEAIILFLKNSPNF